MNLGKQVLALIFLSFAPSSASDALSLGSCRTYFFKMLMNSFSLDESSAPLISVAAVVGGVDRLGVVGREDGFEPCGVAVVEGTPDDEAAAAILTASESASTGLLWSRSGKLRSIL